MDTTVIMTTGGPQGRKTVIDELGGKQTNTKHRYGYVLDLLLLLRQELCFSVPLAIALTKF